MSIVYLSIGSNLGNREGNCLKAVRLLSDKKIKIRKKSSLLETKPWGVRDQPKFINAAIEIETELTPMELLRSLKEIEQELGRVETVKWGPRLIDLDILFYDDIVMTGPELQIPHPHMHEREFVLRPLAEIAPDKTHPVLKKTVREMLSECSREQRT